MEDPQYQSISHKSGRRLNDLLKSDPSINLPKAVRDELDKLRQIPHSPISEDDGIHIHIAQERLIDYLRNRFSQSMGS